MFRNLRTLVVVPARGGSKGVALKNLLPAGGRPLVALVGDVVAQLPWVDRAIVSTDHATIASTAKAAGLAVPFYRPPELSGDRIGDWDVLHHALTTVEALDETTYDVVVMLQPTSPLRLPEQVTATVAKLVDGDFDSVWTVSRSDSKAHPMKQLVLQDDRLAYWDPRGADIIARQQLDDVYHRNGAAYAMTRDCLLRTRSILGARPSAVILDEPMVSIDSLDDFASVEQTLAERLRVAHSASSAAVVSSPPCAANRALTFVVDIDGVLASLVPDNDYARAEPMRENVARVNALHDQGHRIVLFTARGSATGKDWTSVTRQQMAEWGVRHHDLRFGKPAGDFYIDDRMISLADAVQLMEKTGS